MLARGFDTVDRFPLLAFMELSRYDYDFSWPTIITSFLKTWLFTISKNVHNLKKNGSFLTRDFLTPSKPQGTVGKVIKETLKINILEGYGIFDSGRVNGRVGGKDAKNRTFCST